jgi:hypothetical protein
MRYVLPAMVMIAASSAAIAAGKPDRLHTAAAVEATSKAWSLAEYEGDTKALTNLLEPGYVSVSPDGTAHSRQQLIEGAAKRKGLDRQAAQAKIDSYLAAHPSQTHVEFFGDTAVASYLSSGGKAPGAVESSDVFVFKRGAWHAIYSQHANTTA